MEYSVVIEQDEKTGWYAGQCCELPEALSQGKTIPELMDNMKETIELVIESQRKPMHNEIIDVLAKNICKQLDIPIVGNN